MKGLRKIFLFILLTTTGSAGAQSIDVSIIKGINPQNPSSPVWCNVSNSVNWVSGAAVAGTLVYGFLSKDKRSQQNGYELLITTGINVAATELLKNTFGRTRPADKYPGTIFVSSPTVGESMPSGHTSQAFAMATTLSLQYKKWYVVAPAYLWAGSVGYSRVYLGKHYPSDVLAGAIVGAGSAWLSHIITAKLFNRKKSSR